MQRNEIMYVNLTKHPIFIHNDEEIVIKTINVTENVARVVGSRTHKKDYSKSGVQKYELVEGKEIINMPEPKENTIYIVSQIVLQNLSRKRKDVYAPLMRWSKKQKRNICFGIYQLGDECSNEILSN